MAKTFLEYVLFKENQEIFSKAILSLMHKRLKSLGYDIRGSEDVRAILRRGTVFRDGKFFNDDWKNAYDAAVESLEKTKKTLKSKKDLMPSVDFSILRNLGKTGNPKQAGFIDPKGLLVNLSGGDPFGRGIDHRIVGGPQAIKELGAYAGYIRYMPEGNGFEIRKLPTSAQFRQIARLIDLNNGEVVIDLYQGEDSSIKLNELFPAGTKSAKVINAIKRFFGTIV